MLIDRASCPAESPGALTPASCRLGRWGVVEDEIAKLIGRVNDAAYRGYARGTVLVTGADWQPGSPPVFRARVRAAGWNLIAGRLVTDSLGRPLYDYATAELLDCLDVSLEDEDGKPLADDPLLLTS